VREEGGMGARVGSEMGGCVGGMDGVAEALGENKDGKTPQPRSVISVVVKKRVLIMLRIDDFFIFSFPSYPSDYRSFFRYFAKKIPFCTIKYCSILDSREKQNKTREIRM